MSHASTRRILVIDDSEAIHRDFLRILCPGKKAASSELDLLEDALFGPAPSTASPEVVFEVELAFQGQEGLSKVKEALAAGRPFSMAFLDYRMPPGWNGIETLRHLRKVAPSLPVVLCSAYSDSSWEESVRELSPSHMVELRKPFNSQHLRQLALRLSGASQE
jgi:CheY-like chemotaxis protein